MSGLTPLLDLSLLTCVLCSCERMNYIAFITKGLERVFVDELRHSFPDATVGEVGDKRVVFDAPQPPELLQSLRTADDLCLLAAKVEPVQSLDALLAACDALDLAHFRAVVGRRRTLTNDFSITATMAGVKDFTAPQLLAALGDSVARRYAWAFTESDHGNFDVRVFVDRAVAYVGVRLAAQSLMHRSYKQQSRPGSLRPTVAAAMVRLATGRRSGLSIVDNFCGSGTILCEAADAGHRVAGGDIDPESVRVALSNLENIAARHTPHVRALDAVKSRWPDACFDCAISNLPWGKQIELPSIAALFDGAVKEYARIVKPGGVVCLLTPRPEPLIKYAKKHMKGCRVATVPVSFTGQSPTIVVVER